MARHRQQRHHHLQRQRQPLPQQQQSGAVAARDGDGDGVDRLSALPKPIRAHILSLLPTRDAVATGLLSRRWHRRWLHLPQIDLDPAAFYAAARSKPCGATCPMSSFAAFVDLVLPACAVRRSLRRLALRLPCQYCDWAALIDRWVRLAMAARQLASLELDFSGIPWDYELGESSVDILGPIPVPGTLAELKLTSCSFDPSGFGTFVALKTLTLSSVTLNEGDPITQCPLLESLTMCDCKLKGSLKTHHGRLRRLEVQQGTLRWAGNSNMEVDAPRLESMSVVGLLWCEALVVRNALQLTSLVVENCFTDEEEGLGVSLEIEAPKLSRFRLVGAVGSQCSVNGGGGGGPPQVDGVEIEVYPGWEGGDEHNFYWVRELLKGVSSARSLTLSGSCIQCLSVGIYTPETLPNQFHDLKALTLKVGLVSEELPGIACLLRSCPLLQALSISLDDETHDAPIDLVSLDYELQNLDQLYGDYWESQESPINCLVHHLERIEINNYKGKQIEEELARFLVNNAVVLKEMPISTPTSSFSGFDFL